MTPNEVRDKMCIYYGVSPLLTYKNQEHVFPAGLGGNKKLPNDLSGKICRDFLHTVYLIHMERAAVIAVTAGNTAVCDFISHNKNSFLAAIAACSHLPRIYTQSALASTKCPDTMQIFMFSSSSFCRL